MTETILSLPVTDTESAFNPSLLPKIDGGYLLAYRKDYLDAVFKAQPWKLNGAQYWGWKTLVVAEMDGQLQLTGRYIQHSEGEDPRLFRSFNRTWCAYSTCPRGWRVWLASVDFAHHFEKIGAPFLPDYQANRFILSGPDEKNWTWIDEPANQTFDCIYSFQPYRVLRFDEQGQLAGMVELPANLSWSFGPLRGGTPSVRLPSGERLTIFHSHLQGGRFNRNYYAGALLHEPEWPYAPIRLYKLPVLMGRRRFKRWPWCATVSPRARVVYPCGLVAEQDRLLISYGVDDCRCALAELTYAELERFKAYSPASCGKSSKLK